MQNISKYALVPRFQNQKKNNYIDQNRFYKLENAFVFQTRKKNRQNFSECEFIRWSPKRWPRG